MRAALGWGLLALCAVGYGLARVLIALDDARTRRAVDAERQARAAGQWAASRRWQR